MTGMTTQEVAARLGVKVDTVYAYVSRGALTTHRHPGSRLSLFDHDEVESLARRGRPRRNTRPAALDIIVETELTTIVNRTLRFRGRDATQLARTLAFEQAAEWLWTGTELDRVDPWRAHATPLTSADAMTGIRVAVALAAPQEPLRADLRPQAVAATARSLIATMVGALPALSSTRPPRLHVDGSGPPISDTIAGRLWTRLSPRRPPPGLLPTLNAALVLLADHELASSTVAARVAASVRADPYAVVLAGLGAMAGPLHGGASGLAYEMLSDATARSPDIALAAALERHGFLPGFGHRLYPDGDPRARLLLEMTASAVPKSPALRAGQALAFAARRHSGTEPNADFALAVLSSVADMPASAGETIFTIARTAGWIAHAVEEYTEPPLRFRARAIQRRSGDV